ncbi:hypothetical protein BC827DRAFT_336483 [Russula dissimulans]|nr:hypothetical protein BC827DRAFT_336483 [Russula dissimulans]
MRNGESIVDNFNDARLVPIMNNFPHSCDTDRPLLSFHQSNTPAWLALARALALFWLEALNRTNAQRKNWPKYSPELVTQAGAELGRKSPEHGVYNSPYLHSTPCSSTCSYGNSETQSSTPLPDNNHHVNPNLRIQWRSLYGGGGSLYGGGQNSTHRVGRGIHEKKVT